MKKSFKLFIRFLIVIVIIMFITFGIERVLHIKHSKKESQSEVWNWEREHNNYFKIYHKKYSNAGENDDLLIRMKNLEVPEKEKDEKRILVIGDSFVYGVGGTNINYTWWGQLDWRIKEAGYSNVNVYAAGFYALNTNDELNLILMDDELINKIKPDLIIMGYVVNDPEEKDSSGQVKIIDDWEMAKERSKIYKENPTLYYELVDRIHAMSDDKYDELIELGNLLGAQRWDVRCLYMVQGERLERYKKELKMVDDRIRELDIPYFYAITNNIDNHFLEDAIDVVKNEMDKMSIKYFDQKYDMEELMKSMNIVDITYANINPVDEHPGIIWNYDYSKKIYKELIEKYEFLFKNKLDTSVFEKKIEINDTMPFLNVTKIEEDVFEFEYPKKEVHKLLNSSSNFLYYPIEKNYIKLNLEYPKDIENIKITGDNLKEAEVYVNTINEKYGFDYNEAFKKLTPCKYILNNTYSVNKKITSVNIHAVFKSEEDRTLKIEFIE